MRIGLMATYPARAEILRFTLPSLRAQLDKLVVVANEYEAVPPFITDLPRVECLLPRDDLKDVGKFAAGPYSADDLVFLVDDDIVYPPDYVSRMTALWGELAIRDKVIGVHGVIYSDFFDGDPASRVVYGFEQELRAAKVVNQLGTGTVVMRGDMTPTLEAMRFARGFVDVALAAHCFENEWPMIAVPRLAGWLKSIPTSESLYTSVTVSHGKNDAILSLIERFGGFAKLRSAAVAAIHS